MSRHLRRVLFAAIDGRFPCAYNGAIIDHLGVREGHACDPIEAAACGSWWTTRYDSYPPGPSIYALWQIDEEREAARASSVSVRTGVRRARGTSRACAGRVRGARLRRRPPGATARDTGPTALAFAAALTHAPSGFPFAARVHAARSSSLHHTVSPRPVRGRPR